MSGARFELLDRFLRDKRGNIAVIFALAAVPLLTAVGCAVDYTMATKIKAKLQSAADAASVGALAIGSPAYVAAGVMGGNGPVPAGVTDATNIFYANLSSVAAYTNLHVTPTVTKTNSNIASQVTFSAVMPTTFVRLIGIPSITLTGSAQSVGSLPMYL